MWYRWNSLPSSAPTKVKHIANFYEFRDVPQIIHDRNSNSNESERGLAGRHSIFRLLPEQCGNKTKCIPFNFYEFRAVPQVIHDHVLSDKWNTEGAGGATFQIQIYSSRCWSVVDDWDIVLVEFLSSILEPQYEICLSTAKFKIFCLVNN